MNKGVFSTTIYKRQNAIRYTRHPSRQTPVPGHSEGSQGGITIPFPYFSNNSLHLEHNTSQTLSSDMIDTKNDFFYFFNTVYIYLQKRNPIGLFTKEKSDWSLFFNVLQFFDVSATSIYRLLHNHLQVSISRLQIHRNSS